MKQLRAIKHCIPKEAWASIGLAPNFDAPASTSVAFATQSIQLTAREMAAIERWTHTIFPNLRYDVALGVSLASKGLVNILGWYADGNVRLGESWPDFMLLTVQGPIDTRDGKRHPEYHALCELSPLGRNVLKHQEGRIRELLRPNRSSDPILTV